MFWKRKRRSELAASERARLLSSWPAGDYSWPRTDQLEGWSAHDIYLLQDALLSDAAAFPSKKFGPDFAMIYLLGRRAALRGLSLKLLPWQPVTGSGYAGPSHERGYLTGFVDALPHIASRTHPAPPHITELSPD